MFQIFKYCIQYHAFGRKVCDDHAPYLSPRCTRVQALDLCRFVRVSETQINEKGANELPCIISISLQSTEIYSVAKQYKPSKLVKHNKMEIGSKFLDRFFRTSQGTTAFVELHSDASKLDAPARVSQMWTVQFVWSNCQCQPVQ